MEAVYTIVVDRAQGKFIGRYYIWASKNKEEKELREYYSLTPEGIANKLAQYLTPADLEMAKQLTANTDKGAAPAIAAISTPTE